MQQLILVLLHHHQVLHRVPAEAVEAGAAEVQVAEAPVAAVAAVAVAVGKILATSGYLKYCIKETLYYL